LRIWSKASASSRVRLDALTYKDDYHPRWQIYKRKDRAEDERLREKLRNADIGKLKKLMAPLACTPISGHL
jgi:hypothetical protein